MGDSIARKGGEVGGNGEVGVGWGGVGWGEIGWVNFHF